MDGSAPHWREFDTSQTQPETRRTSGDILEPLCKAQAVETGVKVTHDDGDSWVEADGGKASGDSKTVLASPNDGSTQAASNTAQVIRIILVVLF